MPEEIAARYQFTVAEMKEAVRWHFRQRRRRQVTMVCCWCAVAIGMMWVAYEYHQGFVHDARWGMAWIGYVLFVLALITFLPWWRTRRNFLRSTTRDAFTDWVITDAALRVKYSHGASEIRWSAFNRAVLTPAGLLLYTQPILFHWLPRHAFVSPGDYDAVVELARRHIPAFRRVS